MKRPDAGPEAVRAATPAPATSSERWRSVQQLLDGALDLEPPRRAAYLERACGDAELRAEVTRMLAACERAERPDTIFSRPATELAGPLFSGSTAPGSDSGRMPGEVRLAAVTAALAGRYVVQQVLGRGGTATVYLAHDVRHDRAVAVKVLEHAARGASARRFLQEIHIAAGLTHPHVLGVHDSGEVDGVLYYVMPYVEGRTLRARLRSPIPVPEAMRLIRELADALAYAHARGVVHRDLKPENVLLSGAHAVVADFGIARALAAARAEDEDQLASGVRLGTPAYMAPEQIAGRDADHRADLYALGIIAYEILAGEHPFPGRSRQALLAAHLGETPVPLRRRRPEVPPALAAVIGQLLAKEPTARPQSAQAVLDVLATPPAARSRNRRRWVAAAAAAVLTVAGITYAAWSRNLVTARPAAQALPGETAGPEASAPPTIAVLPFQNTGSAEDDYFSDGLRDELAYALARLPGVRLAGRTSSYALRGQAATAQEIGRRLGVADIVTGAVRRAGNRLRVTAELVSTRNGDVVWDSAYESRSGDIFAVQDRLTRAMATALAPALHIEPRVAHRGTTNPEAYDLYLKGRYYWLQRGAANLKRAIGYFQDALAQDPAFARAEAGLAMAYAELPPFLSDPNDSATALAMAAARKAVALDSSLADAQLALGFALDLQLRFREALARYRQGVTLDPSSATAHHWLGFSLLNLGRTDEALAEMRRARELDPLAASPASAVGFALLFARRFAESEAAARQSLDIDSTFAFGTLTLGLAQVFGGRGDSAVSTLEGGLRLHPDDPRIASALLLADAAAGRWADAQRLRQHLNRVDPTAQGIDGALAELVFGNPAALASQLSTRAGQRRFVDEGGAFGCNPLLDPVRGNAHFQAAMRDLTVEPCPLARTWPIAPRDAIRHPS